MVHLSLFISFLALAVSFWNRVETFLNLRRQKKLELVKRVGEALVAAQILKNTLSINIGELESLLKINSENPAINKLIISEFTDKLQIIKTEYEQIWQFVKAFEGIIIHFEKSKNASVDVASVEAKVAHFNQRRELALFDIQYLKDYSQKKTVV